MKYVYDAFVTSVYDGDTITANIDLGFGVELKKQKIRLIGIDTPEVRGEEREQGLVSRDRLRHLILDKHIILQTTRDKKGKYGRWLGAIWPDMEGFHLGYGVSINEQLVREGLAEHVEY